MRYCSLFLLFFTAFQLSAFGQVNGDLKVHAFSGRWVFSVEGGATFGFTDYQRTKPAPFVIGSAERYFPTSNQNIFGIKFNLGWGQVSGEDDRGSVTTRTGVTQDIPSVFITDMFIAGFAGFYSYSIDDKYFPYIQLGFSNIWFDPKDENGLKLEGNLEGSYPKSRSVWDAVLGFKYLVTDILSINLSGGIHITSTDYLDDLFAGFNNDLFYTAAIGISISPFVPGDEDKDGILDDYDACPNKPEDFDGYEDKDGCPEYDNDLDGIPDSLDSCPLSAEDIDGFADTDGCPDPDNDLDGVLDLKDECPDSAEDRDGFLDEDGCPDYDNDGDAIPDSVDKCPNKPETVNGFEDEDGCPDLISVVTVDEIRISAEDLFYDNTATIKPEGIAKLNEALEVIREEPDSRWRIEGHMDSQGSDQFIRTISAERADAVLDFMKFKGLSGDRFTTYGMGDNNPIGDNNTESGRRLNRRIEIIREK
jgi:outer membrane protein OmpA-like peptidoglycan-associated protein